jgi:NAD(P)-dependent dehydrogenase (short-subunit alcohol dehydrogenase family)
LTSIAGCLNWISDKDIKEKLLSPNLTRKEIDDLGNLYLSHVQEGVADSKGWPKPYFVSKILLNALTFVQHRQFEKNDPEKDIVVNSVQPGYVQTDLTRNNGIYTTKDSIPALSLGCFVPPKGQPRGQFIFDDATIADWNQPYEQLEDKMLNRYKLPVNRPPSL